MIRLKRVYEKPSKKSDGYRILVERLWPRGISKEEAHIQQWVKDLAPSPELRKWYSHDVTRWEEFKKRYEQELNDKAGQELLEELAERAEKGVVTFVYAARDEVHNSAAVLKDYLERRK